ncbi:MAG TPA: hypothetical protein PK209_10975, partial [Saprospiraceae bacterium]|nr:hypothetical protein [Saprospiraceae bacterium]
MIFNLRRYFDEVKAASPEGTSFVDVFNEKVQNLSKVKCIQDLNVYKNYVSKFPVWDIVVAKEVENDFDWPLLMQLVCASLSSTASYSIPENWENQFYFHITVDTGDQKVVKRADELWGFQILSLFGIYVKELMEIEITAVEFGAEKKAITERRMENLRNYNYLYRQIETDLML